MIKLWIFFVTVTAIGGISRVHVKRQFTDPFLEPDSVVVDSYNDSILVRDPLSDWLAGLFPTTTKQPPLGEAPKDCKPCECGVPNDHTRIVGGMETKERYLPWMGLLTYNYRFYCGCTLITDRYALTAAHCVKGFQPRYIRVHLLEHDVKNLRNDTVRGVVGFKIHNQYDSNTYNCDIALLKLDKPLEFKEPLKPVCLPDFKKSFTGVDGIVTGWGATRENGPLADKLQEVKVPILSNSECKQSKYGSSRITENMLCAGYKEGGRDSCQGDSGGPMHVLGANGLYQQVGIVSWGQGCARPDYPGVYTRVNRFRSWIVRNTADSCRCEDA
uniref:Putative trypsin-1 n=1 Tax=Lutzomyia longipalpis TaxID=7200 RepID=A0A1B0GJV0_LUTLO